MDRFRTPLRLALTLVACGLLFAFSQLAAGSEIIVEQTTASSERSDRTGINLDATHLPAADTLFFVVQSGEIFITQLPRRVSNRAVDSYMLRRAPALSWVYQRSFFWRTLAKDAGQHLIILDAVAGGSPVDEVVLKLDVR